MPTVMEHVINHSIKNLMLLDQKMEWMIIGLVGGKVAELINPAMSAR